MKMLKNILLKHCTVPCIKTWQFKDHCRGEGNFVATFGENITQFTISSVTSYLTCHFISICCSMFNF